WAYAPTPCASHRPGSARQKWYGMVPYLESEIDVSTERSAPSRRRRREDERRQALLQAALEVFDQAGYGGGSLDQVIERVGGSRRAIYSLFGSKRALFAAMVTELSSQA